MSVEPGHVEPGLGSAQAEPATPAAAAVAPAPLRVLIIDDEPLARLRLRSLLQAITEPPLQVVGEAGDANGLREALAALGHEGCDLVLLDIALPGRDGLQLADKLNQMSWPPAVVFVTAHTEHALRAFELDAVDYLTKPVRRERLQACLSRVAERLRQRRAQREALALPGLAAALTAAKGVLGAVGAGGQDGALDAPGDAVLPPPLTAEPVLVAQDRGRVFRVPVAEVIYLKAELKYVTLVSPHGEWLLEESLTDLEQRLGPGFLRVHRNAVVAVGAVRALERVACESAAPGEAGDTWGVRLVNGHVLTVSRRQLPAVREVLARASA